MSTPVVFRKTPDGKVLAIMPTLPGPKGSMDSVCKGFNEQGECFVDTSLLKATHEATYAEYVKLLDRMALVGYTDIRISQRIKSKYVDMRLAAKKGQPYTDPNRRPLWFPNKAA